MNNNIENLLTEVSRIKVLMNHQKGNESINEQSGLGKLITRLKSLATNSVDDIAKLGNDKLDELLIFMSKTDSADDYFESLYMINSIDEEVAKTLRRDTFIQLPLATQKRLKDIKNVIEKRIGNIPENELDTIIDNLVRQDFPNESEEVITYLKQSIDDLSETISTKRSAGSVSKSIDDILDEIIEGLDDMVPPNLPDDEVSKAWYKKLNLKRDEYKLFLKDAKKNGSPARYWDRKTFDEKMAEVSSMGRTADKDAVRWIEMAAKNNPNWWKRKPAWAKGLFIAGALGIGPEIVEVIIWLFTKRISGFSIFGVTEKLDDLASQVSGGLNSLNSSNESEIKLAIANINEDYNKSGAFDDSKFTLDYSEDGQSVSVVSLTPPYDTLVTYNRNEINESLNKI